MIRPLLTVAFGVATVSCLLAGGFGCQLQKQPEFAVAQPQHAKHVEHYRTVATEIEYPEVCTHANPAAYAPPPRMLSSNEPLQYRPIDLQTAIQLALKNSRVMRNLNGTVLGNPGVIQTVYEPAIREADPRLGVEGALSAFDAQFSNSMFWAYNDRPVNNFFLGGGANLVRQDTFNFESELTKTTATGTTFQARHLLNYEFSNQANQLFPSAWETLYEVETRHPFLQGGGLAFNRIAGPGATPGFLGTTGVLLARVNHDISLADFETGVRNLVSDVENAYWDLYFAYRDLDARLKGRDAALETWRRVSTLFEEGREGGELDQEAQAREQYFLFQAQVQNALAGFPGRGTVSGNGSTGGVLQGVGGVYASERRLRFLLGLPATDCDLLRPTTEPTAAQVVFCWEEILPEALVHRVEIRRQKWLIKQRELELIATKNFTLPTLDGVALYRWRGFGSKLLDPSSDQELFDNAYNTLTGGNFQEWQLGVEFSLPLGFRQGWAAVRQAEWNLTREKAVLHDQELQVSHDLATAVAEADRAYVVSQTNFNRRVAAAVQLNAVEVAYDAGLATLDLLLDAQRRLADADSAYYRTLIEYNLALKNLQLEKGTLLEYDGVFLAETHWPDKSIKDVAEIARRLKPIKIDYLIPHFSSPGVVSAGPENQFTLDGKSQATTGPTPAIAPELDAEAEREDQESKEEPNQEDGPTDTPLETEGQPSDQELDPDATVDRRRPSPIGPGQYLEGQSTPVMFPDDSAQHVAPEVRPGQTTPIRPILDQQAPTGSSPAIAGSNIAGSNIAGSTNAAPTMAAPTMAAPATNSSPVTHPARQRGRSPKILQTASPSSVRSSGRSGPASPPVSPAPRAPGAPAPRPAAPKPTDPKPTDPRTTAPRPGVPGPAHAKPIITGPVVEGSVTEVVPHPPTGKRAPDRQGRPPARQGVLADRGDVGSEVAEARPVEGVELATNIGEGQSTPVSFGQRDGWPAATASGLRGSARPGRVTALRAPQPEDFHLAEADPFADAWTDALTDPFSDPLGGLPAEATEQAPVPADLGAGFDLPSESGNPVGHFDDATTDPVLQAVGGLSRPQAFHENPWANSRSPRKSSPTPSPTSGASKLSRPALPAPSPSPAATRGPLPNQATWGQNKHGRVRYASGALPSPPQNAVFHHPVSWSTVAPSSAAQGTHRTHPDASGQGSWSAASSAAGYAVPR